MFEFSQLAPQIVYYTNVSKKEQDNEIISFIEYGINSGKFKWHESMVNIDGHFVVNNEIRNVYSFGLKYKDVNSNNIEANILRDKIFSIIDPVENHYQDMHQIKKLTEHEGYGILKYEKGNFYLEHSDNAIPKSRQLSIIYYLNSNYEGGEINFPNFNLSIKPETDSILIFPSTDDFRHSVSEIISGTKYAVVSWAK